MLPNRASPDQMLHIVLGGADPLTDTLVKLQSMLSAYPLSTFAAVQALVREGRQYAQTAEGAALRTQLAGSALARRGRLIFEAFGLSELCADSAQRSLPSELLSSLQAALASPQLEHSLSRIVLQAPSRRPA